MPCLSKANNGHDLSQVSAHIVCFSLNISLTNSRSDESADELGSTVSKPGKRTAGVPRAAHAQVCGRMMRRCFGGLLLERDDHVRGNIEELWKSLLPGALRHGLDGIGTFLLFREGVLGAGVSCSCKMQAGLEARRSDLSERLVLTAGTVVILVRGSESTPFGRAGGRRKRAKVSKPLSGYGARRARQSTMIFRDMDGVGV